eukprot:scaffold27204_cov65-Phaeocystis_antarctica.AAC.2
MLAIPSSLSQATAFRGCHDDARVRSPLWRQRGHARPERGRRLEVEVCIHDHRAPADLSNNSSVCRVQGVHLGRGLGFSQSGTCGR